MPELSGAYMRANWAYECLKVLAETAQRWIDLEADTIEVDLDPDVPEPALRIRGVHHPIDPAIPLLISEVVFHLRASLDYLVYELAALDSGVYQDGTQFPIEDSPDFFRKVRRKSYLRGVNDAHVAVIEGLQPYSGAHWAHTLRILSNEDKHRTFPLTLRTISGTFGAHGPPTHTPTGRVKVQMKYQFRLFVAFADGPPIRETLDLLHTKVAETVDLFRPEFE